MVFDRNAYRGRIEAPRQRGSKGTPLARFLGSFFAAGQRMNEKSILHISIVWIFLFPFLFVPISFVRTKEMGERKAAGVPPDPATERIFKMRSGI